MWTGSNNRFKIFGAAGELEGEAEKGSRERNNESPSGAQAHPKCRELIFIIPFDDSEL